MKDISPEGIGHGTAVFHGHRRRATFFANQVRQYYAAGAQIPKESAKTIAINPARPGFDVLDLQLVPHASARR